MADTNDERIQELADTYDWDLTKDQLILCMSNLAATLSSLNMLKTNPELSFDHEDKDFTNHMNSYRNISLDNITLQITEIEIYFSAIKYLMETKYGFKFRDYKDDILKGESYDVRRVKRFKEWKDENPDGWESIKIK